MRRKKVVLYNPRAVYYTMPLALLSVGSALDPLKYEVIIIDARTEKDPENALLKACENAICLGITVLTGAPILDAISQSRLVKEKYPGIHICWGGWHPSLFPEQVLESPWVDSVIVGQGEQSFRELIDVLSDKVENRKSKVEKTVFRPIMNDINELPPVNYGLIDIPAYYKLSGRKQLDYISSQGCRFRCTFCADPEVYKRGWYGISPERIANELAQIRKKHPFEHVHFQDETFFTSSKRIAAIAEEFIKRNLGISWFGTMRADQGARMEEDLFRLCKRSGVERVMVGVESGDQEMLNWMKKDIKIGQVFLTAEKCLRHNIAINFSMIVGFPDESSSSVKESLRVARELRKMHPEFRVSIFHFKPYPGNPIAEYLLKNGYEFPKNLEDWAQFDYVAPKRSAWLEQKMFKEVENFKFYQRLGYSRERGFAKPLQALARWRCEASNYAIPIERMLIEPFVREKLS